MPREHNPALPDGHELRRELRRLFAVQWRRVEGWLERGNGLRSAEARADEPFPDPRDDTPAWRDACTPLLSAIWDEAGRRILAEIGLDPDEWLVTNPHLAAAIESQALAFAESTNRTSQLRSEAAREQVRDALSHGLIDQGEASSQLASRLKAIFDDDGRALRIADTEAKRAYNAATLAGGESSLVVVGWKWLLSSGACPMCHAVADQVGSVPKGQPFATGVGSHPAYSVVKHPPLHPWCACTITQILDTDPAPDFKPPITGKALAEAVKAANAAESESPPA